MQKDIFSN